MTQLFDNKFQQNIISNQEDKILPDPNISIVMAYHNRKDQTITTLDTISKSNIKNFEVIIVDDGSDEEHSLKNIISNYYFKIKLLVIKKNQKTWSNSCVPYNIGFKLAKGNIIIIQNPEVSHIGDVIKYVSDNIHDGKYMVFSVFSSPSFEHNNIYNDIKCYDKNYVYNNFVEKINYDDYKFDYNFYKNKYPDISNLNLTDALFHWKTIGSIEKRICNEAKLYYCDAYAKWKGWYNHPSYNNRQLHFLSAITKNDLNKIGGFNNSFQNGLWYEDKEFLYRVNKICCVENIGTDNCFGIHLYHENGSATHNSKKLRSLTIKNKYIYKKICKNIIFVNIGDKNEYEKYELFEN